MRKKGVPTGMARDRTTLWSYIKSHSLSGLMWQDGITDNTHHQSLSAKRDEGERGTGNRTALGRIVGRGQEHGHV